MNERIKELAEQANKKIRYKIDTHSFKHIDDPDGAYTRVEFDKEKFAELIVRECCNMSHIEDSGIAEVEAALEFWRNKIKEAFEIRE